MIIAVFADLNSTKEIKYTGPIRFFEKTFIPKISNGNGYRVIHHFKGYSVTHFEWPVLELRSLDSHMYILH